MTFLTNSSYISTDVILVGNSSYDTTTTPTYLAKIKPSDGAEADAFGCSVDIGNDRIVVGAYGDDDNGDLSGSAYIFDLNGTQIAKIKPSDGAIGDYFGISATIGNGRIVVGAKFDDDNGTNSGSAYIFGLDGTQIAKIKASDGAAGDLFGHFDVAIGDGRIVVNSTGDDDNGSSSGSAYIFDLNGNQIAKIKASDGAADDFFGCSVAVGNGRIVVGAYGDDDNGTNSGSAYIFDLNGKQIAKIKASDGLNYCFFGRSVAVGDGRIVVGAYGDNGVYPGSAYIFDLNGTQLTKITPTGGAVADYFGFSVRIGNGRIVVGAPADDTSARGAGAAYVYNLDGTQLAKLTAFDGAMLDQFGAYVAVGKGRIAFTAIDDDDNGGTSGSFYLYSTPFQTHLLDLTR